VSLKSTMLLGFIAGVTILLGLPVGRMRRPAVNMRLLLNAMAIGVLLFLVWDVLSHAWAPVEGALTSVRAGTGERGAALGYGVLFAAGLSTGLLSMVYYQGLDGPAAVTGTDACGKSEAARPGSHERGRNRDSTCEPVGQLVDRSPPVAAYRCGHRPAC